MKKSVSPSIILIEGFIPNVIIDVAPFDGALDAAVIAKNDGTESIPTDRARFDVSVLSMAHPVKS